MPLAAPQSVALIRHPGSPPMAVRRIDVEVSWTADGALRLRYFLDGDIGRLTVPPPAASRPTDGLWQHTCFEAFIAGAGSTAYCEFNFSPSSEWAVYGFTGYREGMAPLEHATPPQVAASVTDDRIALEAVVPRETLLALPGDATLRLGLCAVVEDDAGQLSHWALTHPAEAPDFHAAAGFVLRIDRGEAW